MAMHDRLRQARKQAGFKTATAAWKALVAAGHNISQSYYIQNENGLRPNFEADAPTYANFFGVPLDWLMTGRGKPRNVNGLRDGSYLTEPTNVANTYSEVRSGTVENPRIIGRVAAGVFRSVEAIDKMNMSKFPVAPFPVDPRYPVKHQFDLIVEGDSVNKFAQDGDVLRCVAYPDGGTGLHDGDLVIVRRISAGLAETTAKRFRRGQNGEPELWFDSNDPDLQGRFPLAAKEGEEVAIIAVALYAYKPARPVAAGL